MSSIYRLIALAQKTGDTLIVHNPTDDQDIVILDVDRYAELVEGDTWDDGDSWEGPDDMWPPGGMTEGEYWADAQPDDEMVDVDQHDVVSAGDVLTDRFDPSYFSYGDEEMDDEEGGVDEIQHVPVGESEPAPLPPEPPSEESAIAAADDRPVPVQEPSIEPIRQAIPERQASEAGLQWEEEPLPDSDEPTFYEEPVG